MSENDGFLGRWSRRKAGARKQAGPTAGETRPEGSDEALPDIASLNRDSDFTAFMRVGVPDPLRKEALRKLWRLDPAFSRLDGLVEYGEDYTAARYRPAVVRTAWWIGRGMAGEDTGDEPENARRAESSAEETGADAEPDAEGETASNRDRDAGVA